MPVLAELFEAGVQVAQVRNAAHDGFTIQLDDQAQDAMRRGVLRPHVHEQVLAAEIRLLDGGERNAGRVALRIDAGRCQLELDGALAHGMGGSGITPRSRMSSGTSPAAAAMDSSSME